MSRAWLERRFSAIWYSKDRPPAVLRWLSRLYERQSAKRAKKAKGAAHRLAVPVVVIGNITVGGTGKTPLVLGLCEGFALRDYKPGIVTRGYGGAALSQATLATHENALVLGDEVALMRRRSNCPIAVCRDRVAASDLLVGQGCDIVIADDGLQHYQLQRDVEVAVVDSSRGFGNQWLLPAGPLREPVSRLKSVDFVVEHGDPAARWPMKLVGTEVSDYSGENTLSPCAIHAVAGIGNPDRFFQHLRELGFEVSPHPFPDHHEFQTSDLIFSDDKPVVMTEKDAVKCHGKISPDQHWYLPVRAEFSPALVSAILERISSQ